MAALIPGAGERFCRISAISLIYKIPRNSMKRFCIFCRTHVCSVSHEREFLCLVSQQTTQWIQLAFILYPRVASIDSHKPTDRFKSRCTEHGATCAL